MYLAVPVALFFLAMGVVALVLPVRILAPLGVAVETPDGRTEVRAVYGGFGVAVGVLLFVALGVQPIRDGVFVAVAVALGGMAAGRLASALFGERPRLWPTWVFFAVEIALAALLVAAVLV
jgi:hypothetical protein